MQEAPISLSKRKRKTDKVRAKDSDEMKRERQKGLKRPVYIFGRVLATALVLLPLTGTWSWGFFGHQRINRFSVLILPTEMAAFYKKHIEYISEHAVDPDKRRYSVPEEAARHYIDIDHYGKDPFSTVPREWYKAVKMFSEDTLQAYGIVPWHIEKMVKRLTEAFRQENLDRILQLSAELGHYVADAHVPLHTTENYNGQLTNQKGIHGFWESRLPELFAEEYDYFVGRATYIEEPLEVAWQTVRSSHSAVDSVLKFEAMLNERFDKDGKYAVENRGAMNMRTYSREYSAAYNKMLDGMVERRMRASIFVTASLWLTAWVNAGQPDFKRLDDKQVSDSLRLARKAEDELWKTGKLAVPERGHSD